MSKVPAALVKTTAFKPSREMIGAGVVAAIDAGLDGPDGVGDSDILAIWNAMTTAMGSPGLPRPRWVDANDKFWPLGSNPEALWQCEARRRSSGPSEPDDCDWPVCSCDPYASKVLMTLEESGMLCPPAPQCRSGASSSDAALAELEAMIAAHPVKAADFPWAHRSGTIRVRIVNETAEEVQVQLMNECGPGRDPPTRTLSKVEFQEKYNLKPAA